MTVLSLQFRLKLHEGSLFSFAHAPRLNLSIVNLTTLTDGYRRGERASIRKEVERGKTITNAIRSRKDMKTLVAAGCRMPCSNEFFANGQRADRKFNGVLIFGMNVYPRLLFCVAERRHDTGAFAAIAAKGYNKVSIARLIGVRSVKRSCASA